MTNDFEAKVRRWFSKKGDRPIFPKYFISDKEVPRSFKMRYWNNVEQALIDGNLLFKFSFTRKSDFEENFDYMVTNISSLTQLKHGKPSTVLEKYEKGALMICKLGLPGVDVPFANFIRGNMVEARLGVGERASPLKNHFQFKVNAPEPPKPLAMKKAKTYQPSVQFKNKFTPEV